MRNRHGIWAGVAVVTVLAAVTSLTSAQGQAGADVKALYDRSESLGRRTAGTIYNIVDGQAWVEGSARLSYRKSVKGGHEFVLADVAAGTKAPAFDHAKLAASISTAASGSYTAITLPFTSFTYLDNRTAIEFSIGAAGGRQGGGGGGRQGGGVAAGAPAAPRWRCSLTTYACARQTAPADAGPTGAAEGRAGGQGRGGGRAGGAGADETARNQPNNGCWQAMIQNFNVYLRPFATAAPAVCQSQQLTPIMLSTDGSEGNAYTFQSLRWSPDGQKLAAFRRRPGYQRLVHYVDSSPSDQLQPKDSTNFYRKPGDVVDFDVPVVFDVATQKQMSGDVALFPNPYANTQLSWRTDSRAVTFEYNQRGHQLYRVIELDATTGRTRTLIEETQKTFVEYSGKKYRSDPGDGKEIVWASERDGWNHLYLYDGVTGQVKNQITKGQWAVRGVDRVDEQARQVWFRASGMQAGQDPYLIQYYRVNFDGSGLTAITDADGTHDAPVYSPDQQFYLDRWSRVNLPPQAAIKRLSDQKVVMDLEKGDVSDLLKTGWTMPEVFTSKARDGQTDIWGIVIKPTNFDPSRKYPVIENIYAGPQGSFVPKTFSTQGGMMGIAELGFIVVQVDGMGTSNRSKAFHDVAWQNLGDAGFPDRILWHKAVAAKYAWYDTTRVGVYGTSAGGQNAMGGLLFHPEFYKVAYSNSGCHDNRMDKIWWNEQWMGWPIGPQYGASSNVDNAYRLKGKLMLVVPELDTNVDPSSTMQVVNALTKASKDFELMVVPGANHGGASPITMRKRNDWFVKTLLGLNPPNWNDMPVTTAAGGDDGEIDYFELERAPFAIDRAF